MMKKLLTTVTLFVFLSNIIPASTMPASAVRAEAPPPPTPTVEPTVETTPEAIDTTPQSTPPAPPSPEELPKEVQEARARSAMKAVLNKYLDHLGSRYRATLGEVAVDGPWAHGVAVWQSEDAVTEGPIHLLARRDEQGTWQALLPREEGLFPQWVEEVPESLVSSVEKTEVKDQQVTLSTYSMDNENVSKHLSCDQYSVCAREYIDALYGFAVSIPLDWSFYPATEDRKGSVTQFFNFDPGIESLEGENNVKIEIGVFNKNKPEEIDLDVWATPDPDVADELLSQRYVNLAGFSALRQDFSDGDQSGSIYMIPVGTKVYFIAVMPLDLLKNSEVIQVLESFRIVQMYDEIQPQDNQIYMEDHDDSDMHIQSPSGYRLPFVGWHTISAGPGCYYTHTGRSSEAIDFAQMSVGTPIYTTQAGNIVYAIYGWNDGFGNLMKISHGDGYTSWYAHLDSFEETSGEVVWETHIANSGDTGNITGPHLHFEVRDSSNYSVWIRDLPGITWYSGDPNNPCQPSGYNDGEAVGPPLGESGSCTAPSLNSPGDGDTWTDRTVDFSWNAPSSCSGLDVYTFRVVDDPNKIDSGPWVKDYGIDAPDTETTTTFDDDGDYWWAVWPCRGCKTGNPNYGDRSEVRHFQIDTSSPPPSCDPNADQIAMYADPDYGGSCVTLGIGDYPNPGYFGDLGNDNVESIKVGTDVQATLCEHDDYQGRCENFTADDHDLSDNYIGANVVSSAKVESRTQPPSAPTLQSPSDGATFDEGESITLSWSDTGDEYYGETWGGPGGTLTFGWQSGTSYNLGSQWAGYTYSWHVKARNDAGESGWSNTWTFTVKLAAPSNLSAQTASCSEVNLYWNDNSGNEEGYKIYRNGAYVDQVGASTTSYQDTGLSDNTSYSYYVKAFRGSIESDASNTVDVTTPSCAPPQPDLMPSQWGGWQYPVVPSSITDTVVVNTLYASYPTYIDWGLTNAGDASTGGNTYGALYIDDVQIGYYDFGDVSAGQTWAFFDWVHTADEPGWHTLKSVADPDDLIDESDETNNVFERDFYWTPVAPYTDDMESGTGDWTATGLWHQVSEYTSPYPESHSWSHSWWYGQDTTGDYDTGAANAGDLTSPPVYISDTGYYLRFWYRYETETQGPDWDQRRVQISVNGGPFNDVLQLYDDPMNRWLQSPAIDLSDYMGHTVQVRFHFNTVDEQFNNYRGWYIDDFEISDTLPPSCSDIYEFNDNPVEATFIAYGQSLDADICPGGDYDFYQFSGDQGDKVVVDINAMSEGSLLDPHIYLIADDGSTVLAEHDDEITGEVRDSLLGHHLPYTGTYYIKVKAWDHPSAGSTDHFYTINLFTDDTSPSLAEITSPPTDSWLDPEAVTVTVSADDNESGVNRVEFLWHDADWENSDWVWLGADNDGRDGWRWPFDTSAEDEQRGGAFYVWAFDWAGNWTGAGSYNLGIDRTPPDSAYVNTYAPYGDAPFRDFHLYWGGWDALSGVANYDVQVRDSADGVWADLATAITETYTRYVGDDGHTYDFRARARDYAGNVGAYSDVDSYTVDICDVSPDAYESDNTNGSATAFTPDGMSQIHNMHADGDADWVKFTAQAGVTYTLSTANLGGHADTVLTLYDTDGSTQLAENDDCPNRWPSSCLEWQAPRDGTYYVKLTHWDEYAYGCTTEYGLSITSNRPASLELGDPGTAFRYVETLGTTAEPYAVDDQHINWPHSVAVDSSGNLYVTELLGHRLLKYDASGQQLWAFGEAGINLSDEQHLAYPLGVAVDETRDRVYVANNEAHSVHVFDTSGNYVESLGVLGESGSDHDHFNRPKGVTVADDGTLYVSDTENHRVQVFDSAGNYLDTLGAGYGTGDYEFNGPEGLALDGDGRLYVADYRNHRVQVFTAAGIYSTTLGVTGESGADNAHFDHPNAVAVDAADNVYVVDNNNHRIQKFDANLNYVATLGETGVSGSDNAHFDAPAGIAIEPDGTLYVADGNNHRVQKFGADLTYQDTVVGTTDVPYQTDAGYLNRPGDIAMDSEGHRFVTERQGHRLLKLGIDGSVLASVGTPGIWGESNAHLHGPQGVAVGADGPVYVADTDNHRVQIFDNDLNYQTSLGTGECGSGADEFCGPHKIALDAEGRIYVVDTWNQRIQVFDSSYALVATLGVDDTAGSDNLHFHNPRGVAVGADEYIYVADEANARVQKCTLEGACMTFAGETGVIGDDFAHLRAPLDVAVDDQNRVYVLDSYWNQRVQVFDGDGAYLTTIGGSWGDGHGYFRNPNGLGLGPEGTVYLADTDNMRVEAFAPGVSGWTPVNINGFGDPKTTGVSALAEFNEALYAGASNWESDHAQIWRSDTGTTWEEVTPDALANHAVNDLIVFNGELYAGTGWGGGAGQLWRSSDGQTWSAVVTDGFGDSDNEAIAKLAIFNGELYAGTHNAPDGFGIWRSATGDPGTWEPVLTDGNGSPNAFIVTGLTVFNGQLYAACENEVEGAEIWRSADGSAWEQVASGGFDDPDNIQTGGFAVFGDWLYVGTRNDVTGAEIWRSEDGSTWEAVRWNGFGDAENQKLESLVVAYDALYASFYNERTGAQLWRSEDGVDWDVVRADGWGDPNNDATLWNNATLMFDDHLHFGTWNDAHGGELWRFDVQAVRAAFTAAPTSADAPPLTVTFTNLSTGDYTESAWDFGDDGTSTDKHPTHMYEEPGTYTVRLTVNGPGGEDTVTKTDYIVVDENYTVFLPLTLRQ